MDKWNKNTPVEKSSYLNNGKVEIINYDTFVKETDKYYMIDLFCGAGGFSLGCEWAGFQAVLGIDYLEPAMKTWCRNHQNAIGCLGDIKQINPKRIKQMLLKKGINHIQLLTGGVPCQGFSIANRKHNDNDERNFLFLEYMKFVKILNPDCIILENVSGMRSTAGGKFENDIKQYMEELGYVVTVKMINAADYGVPQIRKRLLFVGIKENSDLKKPYRFPKGKFQNEYRTVRDAISDLPTLDNNEEKTEYKKPPLTEYQGIMRGMKKNPNVKRSKRLFNHKAPNHPKETIEKIKNTKPGNAMYSKFKQRIRLNYNKPSPTQLAGGIRPQFQFGHPKQARGLSIRERARIQSFPDSYVFEGGIVQERVQTGNAVPPLMIYNIVKPIIGDMKKKG